jgi:transcriptional regulator with XRE-family HTH domain
LTEDDKDKIRLLRDEGVTLEALAKRFGVSIATISRVCTNRRHPTNVRLCVSSNERQFFLERLPVRFEWLAGA